MFLYYILVDIFIIFLSHGAVNVCMCQYNYIEFL